VEKTAPKSRSICRNKRGVKPSTIGRRLAAIRYAHKFADEPPTNSEAVKATLRWQTIGFSCNDGLAYFIVR
jgi:hypothetical protein